ncbi:carbohydrate-binding module family 13 protein [Nemania abortiva]|nr:carbohydrate-binding module family 13 protein [Nemania abortiva]
MSQFNLVDGAVISLLNYGTGTAMDVVGDTSSNGTGIVAYQFNGGESQQWKLEKASDDPVWPTWRILNITAQKYVDLADGEPEDGTKVQIWDFRENENQLWRIYSADPLGRAFMIQNVGSATHIDLYKGGTENSTQITGWAGHIQDENPNQLWRVLRVK